MTAFVLMTAMPPTTGHLSLMQFAKHLSPLDLRVIVSTQQGEPLRFERAHAVDEAARKLGAITHHHSALTEQDPSVPGFWDIWRDVMDGYGIKCGDYIVASEPYGQKLAEVCDATFVPYDLNRQLNHVKATAVRNDPKYYFYEIIPEFQPYLQTRVTIFGAESTGKTTLAEELAYTLNGRWLFEWARPYLEVTGEPITKGSMNTIWQGQQALQLQGSNLEVPLVIQDTDLFSTIGYWEQPHWRKNLGHAPSGLYAAARNLQSDLYLVCQSNIPFERDPLRYGVDKRESDDQYWINLCEEEQLPYRVINAANFEDRLLEASQIINPIVDTKLGQISYDRHGL
jgi:HTH-type transcriptional repressor of NAD biosynthesis genes